MAVPECIVRCVRFALKLRCGRVIEGEQRQATVRANKTRSEYRVDGVRANRLSRLTSVTLGLSLALAFVVQDANHSPAGAESLRKALARAYMRNPQLGAERARQRATDEAVPQALDGWRPTVTANGDYGVVHQHIKTKRPITRNTNTRDTGGFSISLNQPVFEGLRTHFGTKQAEATVEAGRQTLLNVQQTVLLDGVTAYMDVIRDRTIVALRRKNVAVLSEQLRASKARFDTPKRRPGKS